jgi:hypothetical protein
MSDRGLTLLIAAALLMGCAEKPTLTPSQLNARAGEFDGKEVKVRGWLVFQFEDIGIWDSKMAHDLPHVAGDEAVSLTVDGRSPVWPSNCISYSGPDLGGRSFSRAVVLSGIFRKKILPSGTISNGICNDSGLEVQR